MYDVFRCAASFDSRLFKPEKILKLIIKNCKKVRTKSSYAEHYLILCIFSSWLFKPEKTFKLFMNICKKLRTKGSYAEHHLILCIFSFSVIQTREKWLLSKLWITAKNCEKSRFSLTSNWHSFDAEDHTILAVSRICSVSEVNLNCVLRSSPHVAGGFSKLDVDFKAKRVCGFVWK